MKNFLNRFEIFQNKVGRPSNEVLRKRKIFYGVAIGAGVLLVGGMVGFLTAFSTNKLSGGLFDFFKPTPVSERFKIQGTTGQCYRITPPKSQPNYEVQIRHKKNWYNLYNKQKIYSKSFYGINEICLLKEEYDPEYQAIYVKAPKGSARDWKPIGGKANLSGWGYKEYKIDWPDGTSNRPTTKTTTKNPPASNKKTFTVTFDKNTAEKIGTTSLSCSTNGNNCDITLPSITPKKDYQVYGWNTRKDGHGIEQYQPGQKLNINRSFTLYAITAYNSNTSSRFVLKHGAWDRNSVDIYPPKGVMSYDVEFWAKKPGASDYTKKYWSINLENGKQFGYLLKQQYSNVEDHAIYIRVRDKVSSSFWSDPNKWKPDGSRYDSGKGWVIKEYKQYNFGGSTPPKTTPPKKPTQPATRPPANNSGNNGTAGISSGVVEFFASVIYSEAGASCYKDKTGVGYAVINNTKHDHKGVVNSDTLFREMTNGRLLSTVDNSKLACGFKYNGHCVWKKYSSETLQIAKDVLNKKATNPIGGRTGFWSSDYYKSYSKKNGHKKNHVQICGNSGNVFFDWY